MCPLVDGSLCKAKLALQNALFSISSAERHIFGELTEKLKCIEVPALSI